MRPVFLMLTLLVVSCTTTYGPNGFSGGYKERELEENKYIVSFFGNGYTSGQQVWNYWIYRCAELTLQKGFELFSLDPSNEHAYFLNEDFPPLEFNMINEENKSEQKHLKPVQFYYTSVTTYSSKAIVNMFKPPYDPTINVDMLLDAETIITLLKPYVMSKAKAAPPSKKELIVRAAVEATIKAKMIEKEEAEKLIEISL